MATHHPKTALPVSILDTDLYKFTMQQAVLQYFPDVKATYRFTHRDKGVFFTRECIDILQLSVNRFSELKLTNPERKWLQETCPYFTRDYLKYLAAYRFDPAQVRITFVPLPDDDQRGNVDIEAVGPWAETILWEVPLMACLSEIYFKTVDTDWDYDGQEEMAYEKGRALLQAGCVFSEFGTRRRRSFHTQDLVVRVLVEASRKFPGNGKVAGTSNVYLAFTHGVLPIGTIAHEWFMAIGALKGYENANGTALDVWEMVYPNDLLLALTDTFSTEAFYKDFITDVDRARRWKGLRQDSGDPFTYAPRAREVYASLGIDHHEKTIIFSDALDLEKALQLKTECDAIGFMASFGIGTFLTNDFKSSSSGKTQKSKALNMVIKLASVDDQPCVKISDDLLKNTGDPATVKKVKQIFHLA